VHIEVDEITRRSHFLATDLQATEDLFEVCYDAVDLSLVKLIFSRESANNLHEVFEEAIHRADLADK